MRECFNQGVIVGVAKSKKIKRGNINGEPTISIDVVVKSDLGNGKINEQRIGFFAKQSGKLYKGYETLATELKTEAENGVGDKVKITCSLDMNEFMSKSGEFVSRNKIRGLFCNRLPEGDTTPHSSGIAIELVIMNIADEMKDGRMTGRKLVQAYSVGYNDSVVELKDLVVSDHLATQFAQIYRPMATGKLFIEVHNYAVVEQKAPQTPAQQMGFGSQLSVMPDDVVTSYVNEMVIVGGDMPNVATGYTAQDIEQMRQIRNQVVQKIMSTPAKPQTQNQAPSGFGSGFGNDFNAVPVSDEDMPF